MKSDIIKTEVLEIESYYNEYLAVLQYYNIALYFFIKTVSRMLQGVALKFTSA